MLILCFALIGYIFVRRGASSRAALFFFGCALVVMAAQMYGSFGLIAEHAEKASRIGTTPSIEAFLVIKQFVLLSKDVVGFGVGAFGANVAASAALQNKDSVATGA